MKVVRHNSGETRWAVEERIRGALAPESVIDLDEVLSVVLATVMRVHAAAALRVGEEATGHAERTRRFLAAHGHGPDPGER